jgi:integrase/recombinase XerD
MLANLSPLHQTQAIAVAETTTDMITLWLYGKSENTAKAYRRDLNDFLAFVGGRGEESWTVNDIQAFGTALKANGLKPASVNRKLLAVKSLLSYGQKLGLLRANAGAAVPVERLRNNQADRIISESDVMAMIYSTSNPVERCILKMLYATGCRSSELRNLKWSDATERDGAVQLTIFGKGNKTRQILIKSALWSEVEIATGRSGEFVFSTKTGKPWDASRLDKLVKRAGERVGLTDVSAHWFRHSHASHSLDHGCPIHTVQASLGHSSIETTQRYLHSRPEDGSGLHLAV